MPNIQRQTLEDGIIVLKFDRPDSPANIFDLETLAELESHLDELGKPEAVTRGLIIASTKPGIFMAGADLHAIRKMNTEEVKNFIQRGQDVFNKLAALSFPTVAAVHGAALGGGYEVCLACDWRVASTDSATKIGLPETKLGIIPAWGGCTRLPRLLSVPKALDIILGAKVLPAKQALRAGLVDEVMPREHLLIAARRWLERGKRDHGFTHSATVNAVVDAVIAPGARHDVYKKTHGNFPAIDKALEVILKGSSSWDEKDSLEREREAVTELIASDTTRQLLNLFFLQEKARKFSVTKAARDAKPVARAAVIGAGIMGAGIAQWLSARGVSVILRDIDAERVAAGMGKIAGLYAAGLRSRTFTERDVRVGMDRISPAPTEVPLKGADIVIEAAVEKMDIKKKLFQRLDELVPEDTILATNTSALSISELAAVTRHPSRVVGLHFFNPVHKMQLVEVVQGRDTSPEVAQRAVQFAQRIGKLPVLVKDSPGFLVNRILLPYMIEAAALFWQGASVADVDSAMLNFGMPMGPLRLTDEVGVDISLDVAATLAAAFPSRMHVPDVLPALLGAGMLGRKAGKGFYKYRKGSDASLNKQVVKLRPPRMPNPPNRDEIENRLVLLMVNEAARCLEEGIVASAGEIDLAMVMGTGFAPFRGGPLRHADSVAVAKVADDLTRLATSAGPHYAPCTLIKEMAKSGQRFYDDD
ncbi:MAG: 3-hydroxyacyl-CoA dehydrogenase NAD-binding domain-containing protein [Chthoniobacter sp.]|uniref:3-hydroxyacyl-CoA dehydrogenase NAD-binding domain-containing protein n=1 Tax=Chthoniobacter sp. TaxID=2510640 RepID=UPI0032A81CBB